MTKNTSPKRIIRFLYDLRKVSPGYTWLMILSQVASVLLASAVAPLFVSQLLTHIADGSATLQSSIGLLIGYALVLFVGDVLLFRITLVLDFLAVSKMQATVTLQVMQNLSTKSVNYHADRMSGGTVSNSSKLVSSIERFWDTLTFVAVPILTTIISVCVILSFILWQYAVILAVLSVIIIAVTIFGQNKITPVSRKVAEKASIITGHLSDVISNISTVKAFAAEKDELKSYEKHVQTWRKANLKEMKSVALITSGYGMMMLVMNISAFVLAIVAIEYQFASIGIIYLVISYTLNVVSRLRTVGSTTRAYVSVIGDAGPMIDALSEKDEIVDSSNPLPLRIDKGEITFKNVAFTHEEHTPALFSDFNLTIEAGQQVGLVGNSGSGKTSLTKLLLRFNNLADGEILIDNQNIALVSQDDIHTAIAYVPQEPALFHRTLRENIAYGKRDADDKAIRLAAQEANILDFIDQLPQGLDTIVGERGVKLSGGQRQRIAIARAILKDAPILVLDEATSALDSESESLIQDALEKLMKGRTSIVIAHRLSTIAKLDRVIVLSDGKIVEDGTHTSLLEQDGQYAAMWNRQSGGFLED